MLLAQGAGEVLEVAAHEDACLVLGVLYVIAVIIPVEECLSAFVYG